jgi:hypothetical protein
MPGSLAVTGFNSRERARLRGPKGDRGDTGFSSPPLTVTAPDVEDYVSDTTLVSTPLPVSGIYAVVGTATVENTTSSTQHVQCLLTRGGLTAADAIGGADADVAPGEALPLTAGRAAAGRRSHDDAPPAVQPRGRPRPRPPGPQPLTRRLD